MNRLTVSVIVTACICTTFAQSGLIEGPFVSGSGIYTTVPGGTFEVGDPLTGWSDHNNFATLTTVSFPPMQGDQVGLVTGPSNGFYAVNKSLDNALVSGQQYVLSGFFRGEDLGGSLTIDIGNFGGQSWIQSAQTSVQIDSTTIGKWHFGYVTFTADNPTMRVRLVRNGPTAILANNFFDDIAVTPVSEFQAPSPVPEPATMIFFGLGSMVIMRRYGKK